MTAYNSEKYIKEAIESVLNQSFSEFEFIIVDDGSTDNTVDIIKSYCDDRIKLYINETNQGICYSSNRGIDCSKGEYIARIDSDDICREKRFETQISFLDENENIFACAALISRFNNSGKRWVPFKEGMDTSQIGFRILFENCICHSTVMFRREMYISHGYKYENYIQAHDYYIWTRIIADGLQMAILPEILVDYRENDAGITITNTAKRNKAEATDIRKRYLERYKLDNTTCKVLQSAVDIVDDVYSFKEYIEAIDNWGKVFWTNDISKQENHFQYVIWQVLRNKNKASISMLVEAIVSKKIKLSEMFTKNGARFLINCLVNIVYNEKQARKSGRRD